MATQVIRTIYLDLDDVCNTLAPYALHFMGCPIQPDDYSQFPEGFGFAMHKIVNHFLGTKYTWEEFWPALPQSFWASIPTTDFFPWLVRESRSLVGEENVFLATTPVLTPACVAGKMEWIQKHCPTWLQSQLFITRHKWRLAQPDTLLIDDLEKNIRKFRKHHGHGIIVPRPWNTCSECIVPRPWNTCSECDPQSYIASCLKQFQFCMRGLSI